MTKVSMYSTQHGNHKVWRCRWYAGGKRCSKTLGKVKELPKREAEAMRRDLETAFIKGTESPIRIKGMSLKHFADDYPNRRRQDASGNGYLREAPKLSESTIKLHVMTLRYLQQQFGESRAIGSITLSDASHWIDALASGKLASARKATKQEYTLTQQTIRKHIRNAKAIFNWALLFNLITTNPFAKFDAQPLNSKSNHYITMKEFRKLYKAAPTQELKLMIAICRLAGLRCEAARSLPWSGYATDSEGEKHLIGIDWDRRRICVVGNHKTKRRYREAPIRPLLYRILLKAYDRAEPGAISITCLSPNNLTRLGQSVVKTAGLSPIKKFYQSMRSSCENDWKIKGHAEATYAAWMGHSPTVSRKHYTAPTDQEFAAVAKVA